MEHRNDSTRSFVLAYRPDHRRYEHPPGGAVDGDHRHRMLRPLPEEAAMRCIIVTYVAAVAGAAVGFLTARVFQVGGRS